MPLASLREHPPGYTGGAIGDGAIGGGVIDGGEHTAGVTQDSVNTLNYEIRILGRKGMLSLNAVGRMYDLPQVNKDISKVLNVASFTEGNSYFDFDPKVDHVAAWTIGALVAGKILAKVGFFALIAKFLAPFWKFLVLGFAGIGAWFKRKLGRKKDNDIQQYHSSTPEEDQLSSNEEGHSFNKNDESP